jgi:phosphinothricin acetyltransferase
MTIRLATLADAAAIAAIYGPFCESTAVSFEFAAPTALVMAERIANVLQQNPWLVAEADGQVVGYAYATRHRDRAAYMWSVDTAVYIAEASRGIGVGRALYETLFKVLVAQGYFQAYAGITLPNEASVRLHLGTGFVPVGTYRSVGYKLGRWHDVGWFARELQPLADEPPPPRSIGTVLHVL